MSDVTQILSDIEQGKSQATEKLLPLVYDELRKLAASKLAGESVGNTLDATALVHEAYIKLVDVEKARNWSSRSHFFAAAATAMRRILIDNARKKHSQKRGGGMQRKDLDAVPVPKTDEELLALDEALEKLAAQDPLKAQLVELRFFAGLTSDQAAEVLGISPTTADRYWAFARAWLQTEVRGN